MTTQVLPAILFFIMFSMGLAITVQDFRNVAKYPKAFIIGALLQIFSLPLLAFAFAYFGVGVLGLAPVFAAGLIIIAACPGGVTSNLLTHIGGGDTALSISLTAVISMLSMITIPLIVNLGLTTFAGAAEVATLDVTRTTIGIFIITVVPVSLGMLIKGYKSDFADKIEPWARNIATFLFCFIVLGVILKNSSVFMTSAASLLPTVVLYNVTLMMLAYGLSRVFSLSKPQATAITFECGLQNGTMAIMIALTFLGSREMMVPAAVYSIVMFISSAAFLYFSKKKGDPVQQPKVSMA